MKLQLILLGSIAALLPYSGLSHQAASSVPQPAFGDGFDDTACPALDPADVQEFGSFDVNRIQGNIAKALARKTAFTDIMEGGTLPSGVSVTVRSIVQERAYLGSQSLVRPAFRADTEMCGEVGDTAEVGSTEYTYFLASKRGMGPLVCVKGMRDAFAGSYMVAESSIKQQVVELINSDNRATLVDRSGGKMVIHTGMTFSQMYNGDFAAIDTPFPLDETGVPDAPVNFEILDDLSTFMREALMVEGFEGNQSEPLMKFIGSQEINRRLRNEIGIREDHRYLAAGSYTVGKDALLKYTWEGPYRGWAFGIDPQPLRFSDLDDDGQPLFLEPEIPRPVSKGTGSRVNPAWLRARYEVALALGQGSFARLTPAQYTGEGGFKFPSQVTMGQLIFKVIEDNCKNVWGDFGRHFWQISRAIKPIYPHAVTAIAYKRLQNAYSLAVAPDYADYSSVDSI